MNFVAIQGFNLGICAIRLLDCRLPAPNVLSLTKASKAAQESGNPMILTAREYTLRILAATLGLRSC